MYLYQYLNKLHGYKNTYKPAYLYVTNLLI